jgi:MoCo/4Fe-4S cofactor protein with predicted Tat translocation signal
MDGMSDHDHKLDVDNHPPTPEERELREYPLDLAAVRQKLANKQGKQYWRTLEELSEDPHFTDLMHREFPRAASEWDESVDRRDFLKLMGASLALAGMAGCGKTDDPLIVPYVKQPDGLILGRPQHYATVMPFGGDALGLLVESHEGRPTKVEGNPEHPSSLGATNAFAQAAVLDLYDPDRAKTPTHMARLSIWETFQAQAQGLATSQKAVNGAGMRILTGTITSPTLAAQIEAVLKIFPQAKWHQWEPAVSDGAREGSKLAFGRALNAVYRFERADVVVSLDADFMASGPGHVRYMKDFYKRRTLTGPNDEMNRLYVVEPTPSVTGAAADNRLPLKSNDVELFARALAAKISGGTSAGSAAPPAGSEKFLKAVASDLQKHSGASLVIAGEQQSPEVHALAHMLNEALGNAGTTVHYTEPVEANPVNQRESLQDLCAAMAKGKVDLLIVLGGNPVYDAPHDWDFVSKLKKVAMLVHLSSHVNETSEYAQWHIPEAHFLESWGDARSFDGTYSVMQPLIAPLYRAHTAFEVLAAFTDKPGVTALDAVRERMKAMPGGADADKFWRKSLNDGFVAGSAFVPVSASAKVSLASLPAAKTTADMEFLFRPDPTIYDGRFANNGWLQELAKPLTKIAWDNAALMSPATAEKQGVTHKIMSRGGEHGQVRSAVVDITLSNSKVTAAAWVLPGQADGVVVLPLGYGRKKAGYTGSNKGFNAYMVRASDALFTATGGKVTVTNEDYPLACTQYHHNVEGRKILSTATLEEYKENPNFAREHDETIPPPGLSLYKDYRELGYYKDYKWAMAIDTTKCNGCNACVVACQSENNIPVVGKDQVMRGREMHWIRIDRYYETALKTQEDTPAENHALENPKTFFQPVPCQQCENAPCEQVCPVGATVHSAEGLNDMVYNRCIGTRYCSNNCPYKVRRFNFLRFQDWETPSLKLMRNPEVTVRSRGVMEKCTYCVQRINNVRITAEREGENGASREIKDGEIVTACEQACPSEAIVFGNANDPNSRVSKLRAQQRNFSMLGELNARPRTTYLGAVRNPHPDLTDAKEHA